MNRLPIIESRLERSTSTAARILRISQDTVARLCESGELSARRVGRNGHWRIDYESIIDYQNKMSNSR